MMGEGGQLGYMKEVKEKEWIKVWEKGGKQGQE